METLMMSERGQITIPKELRKRFEMKPNNPVIIEVKEDGLLIKPAMVVELRYFSDDFINELVEDSRYNDEDERKEILKKWGIDDKSIS